MHVEKSMFSFNFQFISSFVLRIEKLVSELIRKQITKSLKPMPKSQAIWKSAHTISKLYPAVFELNNDLQHPLVALARMCLSIGHKKKQIDLKINPFSEIFSVICLLLNSANHTIVEITFANYCQFHVMHCMMKQKKISVHFEY